MADIHYPLRHRIRVRWAETDAQGIVFNGHYLTYFDVGVTEYWRAIGLPYPHTVEGTGVDLFAVRSAVDYHAPAHYDDELDVCARVAHMGNSSIRFEMALQRNGAHITSGELIYVCADPVARKSAPIPARLREAILGFEGAGAGPPATPA